jgi:2-polyprenyl-6-methoxyphenol hydroxylase-like FAD-dependent oxidoreductase
MRIVIVGGGIGGLTAAVALQRAGIDAHVFERQSRIRPVGAGATLWTNAVAALQRIGLGETVAAGGVPLERFQHYTAAGRRVADWPIGDIARQVGAPTVGITRERLMTPIVEALAPGTLHLSAECVDVRDEGGRAIATFADGSEQAADLLVGADGLRSEIRKQVPGQLEPVYSGITVYRAVIDFDEAAVPPRMFHTYYSRGSHFATYRVSGGRLHWEAHQWAAEGGTAVDKAELQARFAHYCRPVPDIIAATDANAINRADFFGRAPAPRWGTGRIVLLGDAAHPMSSYGGQGACQAIEDGVSLGASFAAEGEIGAALARYQAKRLPRTAKLITLNRHLARFTMSRSRLLCGLRDATFPMALGGPAVNGHRRNMEPAL